MKALITGASSGIGKSIAIYLSKLNYDLILIARNKEKLIELKELINTNVEIIPCDLSNIDETKKLCEKIENEKIDVAVNNAGYGLFEEIKDNNLDEELNMIDLNVKSLHILTKFFVNNKYIKYILNVASSAGLMPGGPLMSTYYATKSYVRSYTLAIYEELRRNNSNKSISVLCPGPVSTNFNNRANVEFSLKSLTSEYVAKYAIDKMFQKKLIIIPGLSVKLGIFFTRFIPTKTSLKITYNIQTKKKHK